MKPTIIRKIADLLTEEVLSDIGQDNLVSIDPDSVDVIIQEAMDSIESNVYDKTLNKINEELATVHDHMDKWW